MVDIGSEPSMEEILSSIKRIIAEEEAPAGRKRAVRAGAATLPPAPPPEEDDETEEVLELSDPMPPTSPERRAEPASPELAALATAPAEPDPIVSPGVVDASRGALESLSRLVVKPEPQGDGALEGVVREMLRPMLREWLDRNLPALVEAMVAREIARISGGPR